MNTALPLGDAETRRTSTVRGAATRGLAPVVAWAALGGVFLLLAAYVVISWIISPEFRPVPVGTDPLPLRVLIGVRATEAAAVIVSAVMVWKLIVRPLVKTRDVSLDGLLALNFLCLWWADPIDNYVNFSF